MIEVKIDCHLKQNGKYFNEISGRFKTTESARDWCENQSKGIFRYTLREAEVPREDNGRATRRPSKRKSSAGPSPRKRRKT